MFSKSHKILIFSLIALLALLTYLEAAEPDKINWFPSYAKTDKIPLGTYVSYTLLKDTYTTTILDDVNQPPFEFLNKKRQNNINGTYLFINNQVSFHDSELHKLLDWVDQGNTLFISAKNISENLLDTLHLETEHLLEYNAINTQPKVRLVNTYLASDTFYAYDRDISNPYFNVIDTTQTVILGEVALREKELQDTSTHPNYIKQSFGQGEILLHTFPEAFGNYFMLTDQHNTYTQNVLAYIDASHSVYWDNYYKSGKTFYSALYLFMNNRYLKWAYYILLIGTLFFIFFEGKRKQRSIPIITPLKNQTLAFTRTISAMYYERQQHKEIVKKQYLLFLDYVRTVLRVSTETIDEETIAKIATRSNNTIEDTTTLFKVFNTLQKQPQVTKEELSHLYDLITTFKHIDH